MPEIILSVFALAVSLFLTFLFWNLWEDADKGVLYALFGSLTFVSIFLAVVSGVVCINALFGIGGF